MAKEKEVVEQKPFITIDGVQISVDELPEEGQATFGRLQRLNQKKVHLTLDLEEIQAGINFFSNRIITIFNEAKEPIPVNGENESTLESDDSE